MIWSQDTVQAIKPICKKWLKKLQASDHIRWIHPMTGLCLDYRCTDWQNKNYNWIFFAPNQRLATRQFLVIIWATIMYLHTNCTAIYLFIYHLFIATSATRGYFMAKRIYTKIRHDKTKSHYKKKLQTNISNINKKNTIHTQIYSKFNSVQCLINISKIKVNIKVLSL